MKEVTLLYEADYFLGRSKNLYNYLTSIYRDLHQFPELSFQEKRTSSKVAEELKKMGIEVKEKIGGYGVIGNLKGNKEKPLIALRADMDALPIHEETNLSFSSQHKGIMHACGHDAHTVILLGTAQILSEIKDQLSGSIRFIFQPAEEVNEGAKSMISEGVVDEVDEIYGLHNLPTLETGKVAVKSGAMMGSVDKIEISVIGKGGHGAIPDMSIDPIVASSAIIQGIQSIISREISPIEPVVITIGSIHGGSSYNVIPNEVKIEGTVRTLNLQTQRKIEGRLKELIENVARSYRCFVKIKYINMVPPLVNWEDNVDCVKKAASQIVGENNCIKAQPVLAGEDFSLYLQRKPGAFFWLGCKPKKEEEVFGLHHPKYRIDESCIPLGSAILAMLVYMRIGEIN